MSKIIRYGDDQQSFADVCRQVLASAGGRAERNELGRLVADTLGDDGYRSATWSQFVERVVKACRTHDAKGLPVAQSFDGEVVQRTLWGPDEYARSIQDRRRTIRSESLIIKALREECGARFNVELTIEGKRVAA